jgi:hypothetical protein
MPDFPIAVITATQINVLKDELRVTLRIPYDPEAPGDTLAAAHELRRLHATEMPVLLAIRPFAQQLPLAPEVADEPSDWTTRADDPDRPSGDTLAAFLSGEES